MTTTNLTSEKVPETTIPVSVAYSWTHEAISQLAEDHSQESAIKAIRHVLDQHYPVEKRKRKSTASKSSCKRDPSIRWGSRTHPHQVLDGDFICDGTGAHACIVAGSTARMYGWELGDVSCNECPYEHQQDGSRLSVKTDASPEAV